MSLRKSKGNMYGFVNFTFNTVKGKCPHNCSYCYMKRFPQPELHFDAKELKTNLGSGNFIFVGSSCDMFANAIPKEWILKTLEHCKKYPNNKYLFQSKNPTRFTEFTMNFPQNAILCTTIETNREQYQKYSGGIEFIERWRNRNYYACYKVIITIEPIMDFDLEEFLKLIYYINPIQVNIGGNTNFNVKLPEPSKEKILELIEKLEEFTTVHQKDNLKRLLK